MCSFNQSDEVAMTAWCGQSEVKFFNSYLTSEDAGYLVIICDFCIALVMWLGMIYLKPIIKLQEQEIENEIINAQDFTLVIKCEPDTDATMEEQRAFYWNWAHSLMENDPTQINTPGTNEPAKHLNEIVQVDVGMNNFGYLPTLKKIDDNI